MTIQAIPTNLNYNDYLTIEDICSILQLGRTTVTAKILNNAQPNINYIAPTSARIKKNLFKKSFVIDRVKLYDPNFDHQKIIDYVSEVVQAPSAKEPVISIDNHDLVQSLKSHIDSLAKQIDNLKTTCDTQSSQIDKNQEIISKHLEIIENYQKQVQVLAYKDNPVLQTPRSEDLNNNDILSQNQKEKPKSWLSWLGF